MARSENDSKASGLSRRSFLTGIAAVAAIGASSAFLAACGSSRPAASTAGSQTASAAASAPEASAASAAGAASGSGKVLVAYYSAQGHTEKMAKAIAEELGADTFVIEPADPYTEKDLDYNDDGSRVSQEYEDESKRDLTLKKNAPDDWADYDTVLVGYPIWWMDAAWAMWNFASENDFTGKTVIPFCTSFSSPIGSSGETLAELAGNKGDWQEGHRFDQEAEESEATEWAQSLGI